MNEIFTSTPITITEEYVGYGNKDALSDLNKAALKKELERVNKEIKDTTDEYKATVADGNNGYVEKERIKDAIWYKKEIENYLNYAKESVIEEKTFDDFLAQYDELEKKYREQYTDKDKLNKALVALNRGRESIKNNKKEAKEKYAVNTYDEYEKIKEHEKYLHHNNLTEKQFKRQEFKNKMYKKIGDTVTSTAKKTVNKAKSIPSTVKSTIGSSLKKSFG